MCGIVGRAGPLRLADERPFKVLLLLDWFRGQDSTGVFSLSKSYNVESTLKVADDPIILMQHNDFETTVSGSVDCLWIGHNRASTVGASTRANAHPFTHGSITGVHNGTLEKTSFADLAFRLEENYDTDSETIYAHMAKYGVEDTISRLRGAWALVWYDSSDHSLNMIRNKERPLYICEMERKIISSDKSKNDVLERVLVWASEYEMIEAAKSMSNEPGEFVTDDDGYAFFPLPVDTHHKWLMDDLQKSFTTPEKTPMHGLPPLVATMTTGNKNTNDNADKKDCKTGFTVLEDVEEEVLVNIREDGPGHVLGGHLTLEEWNSLAAYGCSYCGADVDLEMEGLAIYPQDGVVLCPICSEQTVTTITESMAASPISMK